VGRDFVCLHLFQFEFSRRRPQMKRYHFHRRVQFGRQAGRRRKQNLFDRGSEHRSVAFGQFKAAARKRVLVGPAAHKKHRGGVGVAFLERKLGKPGVITGPLIEGHYGVMARITKQHRFEFAVGQEDG